MNSFRYLIAASALLFAFPALAQSPAFPVDANTLSLYTFDGTNPDTTFDISGNDLHALNDGTTSIPGRHGNARLFDGVDDRIDMDTVRIALQGATAWSFEYITRSDNNDGIPRLINHACGNAWRLEVGNRFIIYGYKTGGGCSWNVEVFLDIPALENEWHYFALTFGDGAISVYLDGALLDSQPASGVFQGSGTNLRAWIGHSDAGAGAYFPGVADELRVSTIARTEEEICTTADDLGWPCKIVANEPGADLPQQFRLHAAYPNPFNPQATLRYDVPTGSTVRIAVYDALGREVAVLFDGLNPAGQHEVVFDGHGMPSGVYFVRMAAEGFAQTQTITLLR
ncbi:MAG: T9SS type A sorting domain-containing protein [Bacteroidetes bacterium]|nr:T9SS type A sorting domain-containing protein [Bacteroidota bacterium]